MNRQHLLSRLGRWHDILYSSGVLSVWERDPDKWRDASWLGGQRSQDGVLLDRPSRLALRWPTVPALETLAIRIETARWKRLLGQKGQGPLIAHLFHPSFWPYVKAIAPDFLIYHPFDLFSMQPGWTEMLARWQTLLMQQADLVVAPSDLLAAELAAASGRDVRVVLNAADYDAFAGVRPDAADPDDLAAIAHPRIGYTGSINRKVDFALIAHLAAKRTDWNFVFIGAQGSQDQAGERAFAVCAGRPNVHLLGAKPYRDLPRYVAAMDVNIMCYRMDDTVWTRVAYPLKLHEYLASGRPVVSAPIQSLRPMRDVLAIAQDEQEWEDALADALAGQGPGSSAARQAVARQNTWDDRAQRFNRLLTEMLAAGPHMPSSVPSAALRA